MFKPDKNIARGSNPLQASHIFLPSPLPSPEPAPIGMVPGYGNRPIAVTWTASPQVLRSQSPNEARHRRCVLSLYRNSVSTVSLLDALDNLLRRNPEDTVSTGLVTPLMRGLRQKTRTRAPPGSLGMPLILRTSNWTAHNTQLLLQS
jgi:hypothetical protein